MEIIVSSKQLAPIQALEFKPNYVISILDPRDNHPSFSNAQILSLDFDDICFELKDTAWMYDKVVMPSKENVRDIYQFSKNNFKEDSRILVHCYAGISRSSAAAIISLSAHMDWREAVSKIANLQTMTMLNFYESGTSWFSPNNLMIKYLDEMLGLNGDMEDLVEHTFRQI